MSVKKIALTGIALACMSSIAFAQSTGFYGGISGGETRASKTPASPYSFARDGIVESSSLAQEDWSAAKVLFDEYYIAGDGVSQDSDKTDDAYKLYLGYKVNPNLGIEGGYASLGRFKNKLSVGYPADLPTFNVSSKLSSRASAWFVDAVGTLPVTDQFGLIGRAGLAHVRVKSKQSYSYTCDGPSCDLLDGGEDAEASGSGSSSDSKTRWRPKLGIGAEYKITPAVAIVGEYERYFTVGKKDIGFKSNLNMLSAGIKVSF